jgi:hypothetical protein
MPTPSWRNQILRCVVSKPSPILYPTSRPELWNKGMAICLRLEPDELVLCVRDADRFQVLYKESVWDTDPGYFQVYKDLDVS